MPSKIYKGASARTYKLLLNRAIEMSEQGQIPSLNELAANTDISRATVYRYFPSHADLIRTMMAHSLRNLMEWEPQMQTAQLRFQEALDLLFRDFKQHEPLFRAVLQLSLMQHGEPTPQGKDNPLPRGLRIEIVHRALEPMRPRLPAKDYLQLVTGLTLLFGIEALIVLKDIWGMNLKQAKNSLASSAQALISQAMTNVEANLTLSGGPIVRKQGQPED